jgi:DNA invertase Pin-like site-specific DNA recombinase
MTKGSGLAGALAEIEGAMPRPRRQSARPVVDTTTLAGRFTASLFAAVAELERGLIGERTRLALAEKRKAGVRLGRPRLINDEVVERIDQLRDGGMTFHEIADELNNDGVATASGGRWTALGVDARARRPPP